MKHKFNDSGNGQCDYNVDFVGPCGCVEENEIHEHEGCGFKSCNCDIPRSADEWEEAHRNMYDTP